MMRGFRQTPGQPERPPWIIPFSATTRAGIVLFLLLLVGNAGLNYRNTSQLKAVLGQVVRAHEYLALSGELLQSLVDAETGMRGYVLTGNDSFLGPYDSATSRIGPLLETLNRGLAEAPERASLAARLSVLSDESLDFMHEAVSLRRTGGFERARDLVATQRGKRRMDEIRAVVREIETGETNRLQDHQQRSRTNYWIALLTGVFTTALGVALAGRLLFVMMRNLRERAATAAEIHEQRESLRVTLRSIGDAVVTTDVRGRLVFINRVAESLTGWPLAEAEGRLLAELFQIVDEATGAPIDDPVDLVLRGVPVGGPARSALLRSRDGTTHPIDPGAAPILRQDGSILGAVLVFRDLENRVFLERELFNRNRILTAITDNATTAIFMTDARGACSFMNPAAELMTGYTLAEAGGRVLHDLIHPTRADGSPYPISECPIERALPDQADVRGHEDLFIRKDGTFFPVLCHARPILDEGRPIGTVIEARDVSREKDAELRIYRLLAELQEQDRRKDEFLATFAHEIRNPLAPLRNSLDVLKAAPGDPALSERSIRTMERQLAQMVRLVEDLVDVSRISRGRLQLRRERVGLDSLFAHAIETCRPLLDAKKQVLAIDLPPERIELDADPMRLAQVIENLLDNAGKFTPVGGSISIAARMDGPQVVVSVRDTGIGIPAGMEEKVFDLFTQVDASREQPQSGVGIGLSLVRRLVEMHGGEVSAESGGPGRGSTFTIRLPAASEPESARLPAAASGTALPPAAGRRILIVDDNRDSADSLALLLKLMGHETTAAYDGLEAIEAAQEFRPAVLLLDIGLPGLNGYEVCRRVRSEDWGRRITIIALTGWGQDEDRRKSAAAGFDGHLVKPLDRAALMALLVNSPGPGD